MTTSNKKKIKVFMQHAEQSAVGYYRIIRPAMALNKMKEIQASTFPFSSFNKPPDVSIDDVEDIVAKHDLLLFSRVDNPNGVVFIKAIKDQRYYKNNIPILIDVDDLAKFTTSDNPAYIYYKPGADCNPTMWGEEQLKYADGWITTSKYIGKMLKDINPNYHVIPNCVDFDLIKRWEKPKPHTDIRIGWAGAMAHQEDLEIVKNVVPKILEENPNVTFYFFGLLPGWAHNNPRIKHIKWMNFGNYFNELSKLGLDIAIAPLQDTHFNRAKSNLRWLEYSMLKIPTVASKVYPYVQSIQNGKDGFIVSSDKEWYSILTKLVKQSKFRVRIGNAAFNRVKRDYNIDKWKYKYLEIFQKYIKKGVTNGNRSNLNADSS